MKNCLKVFLTKFTFLKTFLKNQLSDLKVICLID